MSGETHEKFLEMGDSDGSGDGRIYRSRHCPRRTAAPSGLDFNKRAPAAPSSGMNGSFLDLYGSTAFKADIVKRDERAAQMDRLPAPVQRLAQTQGITDIDLLTAISIIHRNCQTMGGEAVVYCSDIGRAMGITTAHAESLAAEGVRKGFIEARTGSRWRSRL